MKFFNSRKRLSYSAGWVLLLFCSSVYSQELKTNYEIFSSIIESKFLQMYDSVFSEVDTLNLKVLDNQFKSHLTEKAELFLNSKGIVISPISRKYTLKAALEDAKVEYPKIVSTPFFGDRKILRQVSAKGYLILVNQEDGSSILTSSFDEKCIDTIYSNEKENVENFNIPFLKSALPTESLLRSLVEPFAAIAVTGAIVYLFFKVRSK